MLRELGLMSILTVLLLLMGYAVGLYLGNPALYLQMALVLAALSNFSVYFFSDKIVLSMTRAQIVSPEQEPRLHQIVERVSQKAGIPKPKVAIVPMPVPNAFATGRSPNKGVIAVTKSLMNELNDDEVETVLGHELAHIKHRDTLIAVMAATIAGAISYLAYVGRLGLWFGNGDKRDRGSPIPVLLALVLVPLAASFTQLAISRGREYKADEASARTTGKPLSLANALIKIEKVARRGKNIDINPATSHLWIVNPFRGEKLLELFSTHPLTSNRVDRLKQIAKEMQVEDAQLLTLPKEVSEPIGGARSPVEKPFMMHSAQSLEAGALEERQRSEGFTEMEEAVLLTLYKTGDINHKSLPRMLAEGFGLYVSLADVEQVLEGLSTRGLIDIKSVFQTYMFGTTYTNLTIGLSFLGRKTAHKLALRRNI